MPAPHNPGLLYVAATLVPLASFFLLLLGGKRWGKVGAYLATAAIGLSCALSLWGMVLYFQAEHHHPAASSSVQQSGGEKPGDADHKKEKHGPPWVASITWAKVGSVGLTDAASSLRLGFYIDGLAVIMFVMITLVATLIHVFSIAYMADELQPQVEDHQAHVTRKGRYPRFFMFLSLFCFSMLNLVLADNLFQVFLSWELVGICSYLLIGFYYERRTASNAANKAFIVNRVGDAGFIIGLLILWTHVGTLHFNDYTVRVPQRGEKGEKAADKVEEQKGLYSLLRSPSADAHDTPMPQAGNFVRVNRVNVEVVLADGTKVTRERLKPDPQGAEVLLFRGDHLDAPPKEFRSKKVKSAEGAVGTYRPEGSDPIPPEHGSPYSTIPHWMLVIAGLGIFLGCVGKSAQFPLQVWLPDAMEGPTPVSALIHAATMVAAGVYLTARALPIFTPEVMLAVAYVGAITLFIAATIAIVQTDIKRVLAYSTVSQLGFMMLALGVGGWTAGLFHLLTHAFFKALLFLGSGSVILGCHHEQEMTKMGGLHAKMKITSLTMLMGVLAIAGTPLFSGWYSKDALLTSSFCFVTIYPEHFLLFLLPLVTAGITAFYMFRLWFMTFTGAPRDPHVYEHARESPWTMTIPLIVLAFFSVVVAWGLPPWDVRQSKLEHVLHHEQPAPYKYTIHDPHDPGRELANLAMDSHLQPVIRQFETNTYVQPLAILGPHDLVGILALLSAGIGVILAMIVYYYGYLDPADTKAQFQGVYQFLWNKWHFDELYRWVFVRPALVAARVCRWIDSKLIDGFVDGSGRSTVRTARGSGRFDLNIIDGLANLTATVVYGVGGWLRVFQTGMIRNYVLFLALAAAGAFAVVAYVMALAG